ncbi:D-glycero-beta-D-manno-heptose-1,7-bisphosphate 7-phosphatase [compost metagenome]
MGKPAVFLDRDGTINVEAGYIHDLANMHLMPGAAAAIKRLNDMGVPAILATNQSGPARGYYPETWVLTLNGHVASLLEAEGARLDDMFYCPHLPDGTVPEYTMDCRCRKPETGMLEDAAAKHGLDLGVSYMIGDKATDVEVGQRAGCRTVLLRSGYGERVISGEYQWQVEPDFVADTLVDAIDWVVADLAARPAARG